MKRKSSVIFFFFFLFFESKASTNDLDHEKNLLLYKQHRAEYQTLNRIKMKEYFATKNSKDFKNSKKFWQFYSASIKIKSDKSANNNLPLQELKCESSTSTNPDEFGNIFNLFFTNLSSTSLSTKEESDQFINSTFSVLKRENKITTSTFSFVPTTAKIVELLLAKLESSSGAGISGLPSKVLKSSNETIAVLLSKLFNHAIRSNTIPLEWKTAVVSPIFKKGDKIDVNNYRGISVLPPVAKIFEKILATQIIIFLNINKILFNGQHGFRAGHSCETALHELLSDLNNIKDKRLIALLLFIDFRKAFDLVDATKLLLKLFHYGFDNNSLDLIANYFTQRSQTVKFNNSNSSFESINLGVPQGSVLGPLFFLLFINDLAFIIELICKMFADDTTLYESDENLDILITKFKKKLEPFIEWCKFNKLDINWSKTFFMFVTNKHIKKKLPKFIAINGVQVEVVESFKLLGVTIDNKLSFTKYSSDMRKIINRKLFSIKRLFYLSTSVKVQFFKTFILPYFDYCLSLLIYFPKYTIQSLSNCFNHCLYMLFKFKLEPEVGCLISNNDVLNYNNKLQSYGLFTFQHRLLYKILTFIHNIINNPYAPSGLKSILKPENINHIAISNLNQSLFVTELRSQRRIFKSDEKITKFNQLTFSYFFTKIIQNFLNSNFNLPFYTI